MIGGYFAGRAALWQVGYASSYGATNAEAAAKSVVYVDYRGVWTLRDQNSRRMPSRNVRTSRS